MKYTIEQLQEAAKLKEDVLKELRKFAVECMKCRGIRRFYVDKADFNTTSFNFSIRCYFTGQEHTFSYSLDKCLMSPKDLADEEEAIVQFKTDIKRALQEQEQIDKELKQLEYLKNKYQR